MELSQVEQELAVTQDHATAVEQIANLLHNPRVSSGDALRLVLLYNLRYENNASNNMGEFIEKLKEKGLDSAELSLIKKMTSYAGLAKRSIYLRIDNLILTLTITLIGGHSIYLRIVTRWLE